MLIAASIVLCLLGILLVCGALPPNHRLGFRTQRTMNNQATWYRAHREFGSVFCSVGVFIGASGIVPNVQAHPAIGIAAILFVAAVLVVVYRRYAA